MQTGRRVGGGASRRCACRTAKTTAVLRTSLFGTLLRCAWRETQSAGAHGPSRRQVSAGLHGGRGPRPRGAVTQGCEKKGRTLSRMSCSNGLCSSKCAHRANVLDLGEQQRMIAQEIAGTRVHTLREQADRAGDFLHSIQDGFGIFFAIHQGVNRSQPESARQECALEFTQGYLLFLDARRLEGIEAINETVDA